MIHKKIKRVVKKVVRSAKGLVETALGKGGEREQKRATRRLVAARSRESTAIRDRSSIETQFADLRASRAVQLRIRNTDRRDYVKYLRR